MPTPSDDTQLMCRVQADDEAALGALMERWELPVKALIARMVLNAREAEELAQETFVRLWQQRARFRSTAEFRPWVFSIAINLARNRLRWWRRRPEVALEEWTLVENGRDPSAQAAGSPANVAEARERSAAVRDAIAALPAGLREAIVLFEYQQLSHAEMAAVLRCTPKAVESRLRRAREKLRERLVATNRFAGRGGASDQNVQVKLPRTR